MIVSVNAYASLPLSILSTQQAANQATKQTTPQLTKQVSSPILKKLPLYFEKNVGQHPNEFHFVAKTEFSQFAFADDRVFIQLKGKESKHYKQFSLVFEGAAKTPSIIANKASPYKVNYYRGKKSQWRENVSTFSEIVYQEIYPGIDLKFYFNGSRLEYDFIVNAGVDPSVIQFKYENTDAISISKDNTLDILISKGIVQQQAPVIFQIENGQKRIIQGSYARHENHFSFNLAGYDQSKELVIDPVIDFSSYFGGNWEDNATSVATDSAGNIFLAGSTSAQARITVNNIMTLENSALAAMDDAGSLSTHDGIHGFDFPLNFNASNKLDLNSDEKITIVNGSEVREDYVYTCDYRYNGFFDKDDMKTDYDGFISKFDSSFNQIYTTYYGGCRNDGIRDMVIHNDNVYVAGFTLSDNLPPVSGYQTALAPSRFTSEPVQSDAFYAKFDNDGVLIYSSYLGGNGRDGARAIAVDSNEYVYITGYTHSTDLSSCSTVVKNVVDCAYIGGIELEKDLLDGGKETSIFSDAFVAKISPSGDALSFITYFGGSLDDWGQNIVVAENSLDPLHDGIYISGNTASPDLPTLSTGYSLLNYQSNTQPCSRITGFEDSVSLAPDAHACEDIYLAKLSMDGTELGFSTYLGGKLDDNVSDMEIDHLGNIYLLGTARSQGARFELNTLLPPAPTLLNPTTATEQEILQYEADLKTYKEDNALTLALLNFRFPLYKNITELGFDFDETSSMAFLTVFKPDGDKLVLSTFIGGNDDDAGLSLELNDDGVSTDIGVYIGGHTLSNNFYSKLAFQQTASNSDLFVVSLAMHLLKADDAYDVPVCSDPNDPNTCANPAGSTCNNESCDLYGINYSTLIGGEDLDALKDMHYSKFDGGLFLAGTTYSTLFPVTSNALKSSITEVKIRDYDPLTRALEFESAYYPSDMLFMKLSDLDVSSDWNLDVNVTSGSDVREGERITYEITISRVASSTQIGISSARINLSFPYLAADEDMAKYATLGNVNQCVMEYKQIYCTLGDLSANEVKVVTVSLLPRVTGNFPVDFSLSSDTGDTDLSNNTESAMVRVRLSPSSGVVSIWFISILLILMFSSRKTGNRVLVAKDYLIYK